MMRTQKTIQKARVLILVVALLVLTNCDKGVNTETDERSLWLTAMLDIAHPVLFYLSENTLVENMPVETNEAGSVRNRHLVSHLEAVGRTICGIAPWLELGADNSDEGQLRKEYIQMTLKGLTNMVDSASADFLGFSVNRQNLVDAAFLAQGFLRAPNQLWHGMDQHTQALMVSSLKATREFKPLESNWLLFSAIVEAALYKFTGEADFETIDYALTRFDQWYKGDSFYGDGPRFHFDYYNSLVIHPMLTDILFAIRDVSPQYQQMYDLQLERMVRHADILERMISPDGAYPVVGRSLVYRFGAFHALSHVALMQELPDHIAPSQVRSALTTVIERQMSVDNTFDGNGWLRLGFAGHQPDVAESYISTGSLYLCAAVFLPLGLEPENPFWKNPATDWSSRKAWAGKEFKIDKAIRN